MESKNKNISAGSSPEAISTEPVSARHALRRTNRGANILRFFLMPFVCFASFGFPGPYGDFIMRLCLFAPIAFYILCGFMLTYREENDPEIYGRLMKRSAAQFALVFTIMIIMNGILLGMTGLISEVVSQVFTKRTLFNIIVLCTWPFRIGETIWFIQSLFYARVILYFMNKHGLMRHYKKVLIVTALLTVFAGEFAGVIHFNFLGYNYIPGNAITRAIPYMLLGRFLYEKRDILFSRPSWNYCLMFLAGILAVIMEWIFLAKIGCLIYTGHMIGYGVMAFSACCLFLKMKQVKRNFYVKNGRSYSWRIYVLSQPVGHLLFGTSYAGQFSYILMQMFGGIIVYLTCLAITFAIGFVIDTMRE